LKKGGKGGFWWSEEIPLHPPLRKGDLELLRDVVRALSSDS
jgi:hypothetical protein